MAGYDGYSKSNNAVDAESEGRYPMTAAKKIVAQKTGITQAVAAKALKALYKKEYHHTSKFYNCTDYYDTRATVKAIEFAKGNGIEIDGTYLNTLRAYGLQDADEWGFIDVDEFKADVATGKWAK